MFKRLVIATSAVGVAVIILFISVLRTASVRYEFSGDVADSVLGDSDSHEIAYPLAFPGKVLPDNPLWGAKALRDKIWLETTTNDSRKAELLLLIADKRIAASRILFEREDYELGYGTMVKAENYLSMSLEQERVAHSRGSDTSELLERISIASLKHREVIEFIILPHAPTDAQPEIVHTLDITKQVYEKSAQYLREKGKAVPHNPFEE